FPVAGTLMIEPTESEDLAEIDRFCEAMIAIRAEIDKVAAGVYEASAEDGEGSAAGAAAGDQRDAPLRNAPHTAAMLAAERTPPYSRQEAAYPSGVDSIGKYWAPVRRIDQAYGARHLVGACPPVSEYAE